MEVQMKNNYLMVKSIKETDQTSKGGIFLPESTLQDDQVAQGEVLEGNEEYKKGDIVLFHKIIPVDAQITYKGESQKVWFIQIKDIICKI